MLKPPYCFNCHCPLSHIGESFSIPDGKGTCGVVIVGEALGHDEAIDGLPFRPKAQSGSKLEEIFRLTGMNREMFYLWNIIACQPPGNKLEGMGYETRAIECCKRHFDNIVGNFSTTFNKTILALGNVPLKVLTGVSGVAKEKQSITFLRGFVLNSPYGNVVASYHPSFLKRGKPEFTPTLVADLRKAVDVASGKYNDYPTAKGYQKPRYQEYPSLDEVRSFYYKCRDSQQLPISCDIETPNSKDIEEDEREELEETEIIQVQFSIEKRTGIAIPFKNGYVEVIKNIFELPNVKLGFNWWNFDGPRIKSRGINVKGHVFDLMWCWKHYHPKLERGLQKVASLFGFPFPWKHLMGANLQWYGCADVDAPLYIFEKLPGLMKERGVWEGWKQTYKVHLILDKARERGLPVNESKRVELEGQLRERREKLDAELQKDIPDEIKNISPRRKDKKTGEITFGYIREPREIKDARAFYRRKLAEFEGRTRDKTEGTNSGCKGHSGESVTFGESRNQQTPGDKPEVQRLGRRFVPFYVYVKRKYGLVRRDFQVIDKETGEPTIVKRWCKILPFKASKEQLVKYLRYKQRELMKEPDRKVEKE